MDMTSFPERPWLAIGAIRFLKHILRKDMRIFEYGAGGSTLFFAKRAKEVMSVEHDKGWHQKTLEALQKLRHTNWKAELVEPEPDQDYLGKKADDPDAYISSDENYHGKSFEAYAKSIEKYPDGYFDIILIDGRARPSCFKHAVRKVKEGGYLILDNADRKEYSYIHDYLANNSWRKKIFEGPTPYTSTVIHTDVWKKGAANKPSLLELISNWQCERQYRAEYANQRVEHINERPVEYSFLFRQIAQLYPERIMDVGTGITALPRLMRNCGFYVTAIDNIRNYWPHGMTNRHYHVIDSDITRPSMYDSFDLVSCISVLEHIFCHKKAIENIFRLLRPGGHFVLTCPYTEGHYIPNCYKIPGSDAFGKSLPFICQSFSREIMTDWIRQVNGVIVEQEYWQFYTGPCWSVGKYLIPPKPVDAKRLHQITCVLIRKP